MLERTAAGLESCSLQRVVAKPVKRCRRLHTGFWQHGASAIDMTSVWPGFQRDNEPEAAEESSNTQQLQSGLIASAFLLDFLYPTTTLPLLRRIYPSLPRAQDGQSTAVSSSRRPYSSTSTATIAEPRHPREEYFLGTSASRDGRAEGHYKSVAASNRRPSTYAHFDSEYSEELPPASILDTPLQARKSTHLDNDDGVGHLQTLLADPEGKLYAEIWDLYLHLDHEDRVPVRANVLRYLARSTGFVETGRAASVFRQIPVEQWTNDIMDAGIAVTLRATDLTHALKVFKTGLETKGLSGGLEHILATAIKSRLWDSVLGAWIAYCTAETRKTRRLPDSTRLQILETMNNLGPLYFGFRTYLATHGSDYLIKIKQGSVSRGAFRTFDRYFTRVTLTEPCTPEQATTILDYKKDAGLYNTYLQRMLARWYDNEEPRSQAVKLLRIYESYRELPGARPSPKVLHGIFNINFPNNIVNLDQLYQDWIRFHGRLDQYSYEKFMNLAAHRGDVRTVRRLWKQLIAEHPDTLHSTRGFRSILNVYASLGDIAGTEREFVDMTKKYKIEPDISCWNVLLKAYVRANDYDGALKCFDRICKNQAPDSYTYNHIMAMSSKKGDLETTLAYFARSQETRVPLSPEMSLSLIVVYGLNNLLIEAESLCMELATRNLTNADIWNQLINFYGMRGDLVKCTEILRQMEKFGIEPNEQTYGFVIQPLLKTNRIQDAFVLLERGEKQGLFTVTPEHYAAIMVGAARVGQFTLVEVLHRRMKERNLPPTFTALVALVDTAVKRKPGSERTRVLSQELLTRFREAVAATEASEENGVLGIPTQGIQELKERSNTMGRAVMLLVQLRDLASLEELMTLYTELFPHTKKGDEFPADVVSALMLAYYNEMQYGKVVELWNAIWPRIEKTWLKPGGGVLPKHEYDLSRVLPVLFKSFRTLGDTAGCVDCMDKLQSNGFKLTLSGWQSAITSMVRTGNWQRAMHLCETILMPGWRGWNSQAYDLKTMRDRSTLKPTKRLVHLLSIEWLKMRKMAAWSPEASRALRDVEAQHPRLVTAFTRMEFSEKRQAREHQLISPAKDLDFMLKNMSHKDLMKVKHVLLRQLIQERKSEKKLGLVREGKTPKEREQWKRALHTKIRRYALAWAKRREALKTAILTKETDIDEIEQIAKDSQNEEITEPRNSDKDVLAAPEEEDTAEHKGYWDDFWKRYDQVPHPHPSTKADTIRWKKNAPQNKKKKTNWH